MGFTRNLKERLLTHNQGGCHHTAKFIPWRLEFYSAFKDESRATQFERYLKFHYSSTHLIHAGGAAETRREISLIFTVARISLSKCQKPMSPRTRYTKSGLINLSRTV